MPIPTLQEAKDHITAAMDSDYLRVTRHLIDERLRAVEAENPIQQQPSVATPATATEKSPEPTPKSDTPAAKTAPTQAKTADAAKPAAKK
jgi:hypothetical protein